MSNLALWVSIVALVVAVLSLPAFDRLTDRLTGLRHRRQPPPLLLKREPTEPRLANYYAGGNGGNSLYVPTPGGSGGPTIYVPDEEESGKN